jgi:hypothetical protein
MKDLEEAVRQIHLKSRAALPQESRILKRPLTKSASKIRKNSNNNTPTIMKTNVRSLKLSKPKSWSKRVGIKAEHHQISSLREPVAMSEEEKIIKSVQVSCFTFHKKLRVVI